MTESVREIEQAALTWLTRINDPEFDAWDEWQGWLEADARRGDVYWRLAAMEADANDALAANVTMRPAASPPSRRSRSPVRLAFAIAATLVLSIGLWWGWSSSPRPWFVETAPGEQRTLALADGSVMHLDGGTLVRMDRRRVRDASLEHGRILVEVEHDARRPFRVQVGDAMLTDLGTVFDVTRRADGFRVAVSEGVVRVDVQDRTATLNAGEGLVLDQGRITRQQPSPAEVGGWREGRLAYYDERLEVVAEDLSRALGQPISVAPEIIDRRFTGSLAASDVDLRPRIERLLEVEVRDDGDGWRLTPRSDR